MELKLYPNVVTSGNFGTINFTKTKSSNGTSTLRDLIENGPAAADWPDLADFLAYGPARTKFSALVEAFRPGENEEMKSMDQALQTVDLKVETVNKGFRTWMLRPN